MADDPEHPTLGFSVLHLEEFGFRLGIVSCRPGLGQGLDECDPAGLRLLGRRLQEASGLGQPDRGLGGCDLGRRPCWIKCVMRGNATGVLFACLVSTS